MATYILLAAGVDPRLLADPGVSSNVIWFWPPLGGFLLIECLGGLLFAPARSPPARGALSSSSWK